VGTGFWVIQGIFLTAAIATAIYAEVERRRDDAGSTPPSASVRTDYRRVPVERTNAFTIHEQARLLLLRGKIREARLGRGRLRDDLVPDALEPLVLPNAEAGEARLPPARRPVMRPTVGDSHTPAGAAPAPAPRVPRWSTQTWILVAGVLLLVGGLGGVWQTNVAINAIEHSVLQSSGTPSLSLVARLLPGPVSNPAKYLGAVNGGGGNTATLDSVALLAQKQAMDRWEAMLLTGLALLIFSLSRPKATTTDGEPETSVAGDLVGFIGLAALLFAGLSFFELP
jgi:hypothetical protein